MEIIYKRINKEGAGIVFLIAAIVYCLTVEPSASFWDCGEFITSAYKLEIGHPPGAPFFMLTANVFTQLTGDKMLAAKMVNYMSALMSAATILFLYLSITHLMKRVILSEGVPLDKARLIKVIGSGMVGALAYTFSDTFWFSAVEGEVYAYSSLFTALVFWLILKWEEAADEPHSDRWLVLIAYLTGLSIGVHLLNLLCLPALALVFYYRRFPLVNWRGTCLALFFAALLVAVVLYGIVPGVMKVAGWMEFLSVNIFHFSYQSGLITYLFILFAALCWGIYETYKGKNEVKMIFSFLLSIALLGIPFYGDGVWGVTIGGVLLILTGLFLSSKIGKKKPASPRLLHTVLLCSLMMVIGYSSYAVIVVRSAANPPMDQNSPEDIFALRDYLGREQYGDRPLFKGKSFASQPILKAEDGYCAYEKIKGNPVYRKKAKQTYCEVKQPTLDTSDEYIKVRDRWDLKYAQVMWFPRMYHENYTNEYRRWVNIKGENVLFNRCGEQVTVNVPTQWENLRFFFRYQLHYMYWRYFLWNFVGKQNDFQGQGEVEHGNWITGFNFIDRWLMGDLDKTPEELRSNPGRNVFYGLPFLLGLAGIFFLLCGNNVSRRVFLIVFFLFFMTGIAIIFYLNQPPLQVRERDYAYAGSFYAFAIYIGMGIVPLASFINRILKRKTAAALISVLLGLVVCVQMAGQTWDDHDRSHRYICRDTGRNYLQSCQQKGNPILFTNGDNETFPLWYNIEVENFRTDIRVCNLSYLNTDWYIDQMKRPAYSSPALPIPWSPEEYREGLREYVYIRPELKEQLKEYYRLDPIQATKDFGENPFEVRNIMKYWVRSPREGMQIIPTDSLVITLDKEAVARSGICLPDSLYGRIPDTMILSLKGKKAVTKAELMMLEIISGANWERPVYMSITSGEEYQFCFSDFLVQEGLVYRVVPFNTALYGGKIDTEKIYENLIHRFSWGEADRKDTYIDETNRRMIKGLRHLCATTIAALLEKGEKGKAREILELVEKRLPVYNFPVDYLAGDFVISDAYYRLGEIEKGEQRAGKLIDKSVEYVEYYISLPRRYWQGVKNAARFHLYIINEVINEMSAYHSPCVQSQIKRFEQLYERVSRKIEEDREFM